MQCFFLWFYRSNTSNKSDDEAVCNAIISTKEMPSVQTTTAKIDFEEEGLKLLRELARGEKMDPTEKNPFERLSEDWWTFEKDKSDCLAKITEKMMKDFRKTHQLWCKNRGVEIDPADDKRRIGAYLKQLQAQGQFKGIDVEAFLRDFRSVDSNELSNENQEN